MAPDAKRTPYFILLFMFFPLALGGFVLCALDVASGVRSYEWTAVKGAVLSAGLRPSFLAPQQAEVRYSYNVDGLAFVSDRVWPGALSSAMPQSPAGVRRTLALFPAGTSVEVFMNPRNPNETALVRGPGRAVRWALVFAAFVAAGAVSPFLLARALRKHPPDSPGP